MQRLIEINSKPTKLAIGLMSGTSVDGIDAALVEITGNGPATEIAVLAHLEYSYPVGLQEKILALSQPGQGTVDEICRINVLVGECFATAAQILLNKAKRSNSEIDFIGSHGQTIHHLPDYLDMFGYQIHGTFQIGEPAVIAKKTGILTVADFRPADMALGGHGAPLVPFFDYVMFRSTKVSRVLVNIGGICNLTFLPTDCSVSDVLAFDTGPGNMVVDYLTKAFFGRPFDADGDIAANGKVSNELLTFAFSHPYFSEPAPKSTGRETFGSGYCQAFVRKGRDLGLQSEDLVTTAAELTVHSLGASLAGRKIDEIFVSGGGARNKFMMDRIRRRMKGTKILPMDDLGIPSGAKEAVCFAVLANETLCGNAANLPAATGASQSTILGKICF